MIVLTDSEGESEDERKSESESDEESDEEEIVYESEEDEIDKLERQLKKREPPRRAGKDEKKKQKRPRYSSDEDDGEEEEEEAEEGGSDSDSDSEEEDDDEAYIPWEKLRRQYQDGERDEEPAGLTDHPQVHVPGWKRKGGAWTQAEKDALWASIRVKTTNQGFHKKWGMAATERQVGDSTVRIVHRTDYGFKFRKALKKHPMGSYMLGFIPTMVELFQQQPWQPFFDQTDVDERTIPMPMFEDFEAAYHFDNRGPNGLDLAAMNEDEGDGPMWCLCTQCTKKGLENVTIMRHIPSGILVAVGGNCAAYMVGESRLNELVDFKLNGQSQYDVVKQVLGWS